MIMILFLILFTVASGQQPVFVNNNNPARSYFLVGNNPQASELTNISLIHMKLFLMDQVRTSAASNTSTSIPAQCSTGKSETEKGKQKIQTFNYGPVRSPLPQKLRIPQRKGGSGLVQSSSYIQPKNSYSKPVEHTEYIFPERQTPLRECFFNPSGYACCNRELNQVIINTYQELAATSNFDNCNTQRIANALQKNCQNRFGIHFEAVVGLNDYAQRVNFRGNYVCKVEMGGRYMLAYGTPESTRTNENVNSPVEAQNKEQYKESHQ
uniref:Ground-like domain-containing protein n=1 Tax=Heterorhabditis bacteriophora TaxID=37862 RepID=A0A1I7XGP7_HETBA